MRPNCTDVGTKTIGVYVWEQLQQNPHFRPAAHLFYRHDHLREFDLFWQCQCRQHPDLLTSEAYYYLRDSVLFYQHPPRKRIRVNRDCPFEHHHHKTAISNPAYQLLQMLSVLNTLQIRDLKTGLSHRPSPAQRNRLIEYLSRCGGAKASQLLAVLDLPAYRYRLSPRYIRGEETGSAVFGKLRGSLKARGTPVASRQQTLTDYDSLYTLQGVIDGGRLQIDENTGLFALWHLLYQKDTTDHKSHLLQKRFGLTFALAESLSTLRFSHRQAPYSTRAIRKLLPYLIQGETLPSAIQRCGYDRQRADGLTQGNLRLLKPGSLYHPLYERIANGLYQLVNAILNHPAYGRPDLIRLQLAPELRLTDRGRQARNRPSDGIHSGLGELSAYLGRPVKGVGKGRPTSFQRLRASLYLQQGGMDLITLTDLPLDLLTDTDRMTTLTWKAEEQHRTRKVMVLTGAPEETLQRVEEAGGLYGYHLQKGSLEVYEALIQRLYRERLLPLSMYFLFLDQDPFYPLHQRHGHLKHSFQSRAMVEHMLRLGIPIEETYLPLTQRLIDHWELNRTLEEVRYEERMDHQVNPEGALGFARQAGWATDGRYAILQALTVALTTPDCVQAYTSNDPAILLAEPNRGIPEPVKFALTNLLRQTVVTAKVGQKLAYKRRNGSTAPRQWIPARPLYEDSRYRPQGEQRVFTIRYPVEKAIEHPDRILEETLRRQVQMRLAELGHLPANAQINHLRQTLATHPLTRSDGQPVRHLRCWTLVRGIRKELNQETNHSVYRRSAANHHLAIYRRSNGELYFQAVTIAEAFERLKNGIPPVEGEPADGSTLIEWFAKNDLAVIGLPQDVVEECLGEGNLAELTPYLYRLQKFSSSGIYFRHHACLFKGEQGSQGATLLRLTSFNDSVPIKLRANRLGDAWIA